MGDGDLAVGDVAAFGGAEGVGGEGEQAGAGEGVEQSVELLAVFGEGEVGVELAGGGAARGDCGEDGAEVVALAGSRLAHGRAGCSGRMAEVAVAAGARGSLRSPKCWMSAVMRHVVPSAKATMRSIWRRRKASCAS